jgi:soluble cytochrome b562
MTAEYDEEPISLEEYNEIKSDYDKVIDLVHKAQEHVQQNSMDEALHTLSDIDTDCSICEGEIDDAKRKIEMVHDICNIEKIASEAKCQKMSNFILDNLGEFVLNINMALNELESEAHGNPQENT